MPATLKIKGESITSIHGSQDPVAALVAFLQEHVSSGLLEYEKVIPLQGYEDDGTEPQIIVMVSKLEENRVTITADLVYHLFEQQNSCADGLPSIRHTARIIYNHELGSDVVSVEKDVTQFDQDYHPGEYGG